MVSISYYGIFLLFVPYYRLIQAEIEVVIASIKKRKIRGKHG